MSLDHQAQARPAARAIPLALAGTALLAHLIAGWVDEARFTLSPVGPLTVFVAVLWVGTILACVATARLAPRRAGTQVLVSLVAVLALVALFVRG